MKSKHQAPTQNITANQMIVSIFAGNTILVDELCVKVNYRIGQGLSNS